MKRIIAGVLAVASMAMLQVAMARPEAVGLPRRALTEVELIEFVANTDCIDPAQRVNKVSEVEALAIARKAVSASDTFSLKGTDFGATRDDCGWWVYVMLPSPGPGAHRSVRIDGNGRVLAYVRGL